MLTTTKATASTIPFGDINNNSLINTDDALTQEAIVIRTVASISASYVILLVVLIYNNEIQSFLYISLYRFLCALFHYFLTYGVGAIFLD